MEQLARYNILLELVSNVDKAKSDINSIKKEATGLSGVFQRAKGVFAGIVAANVASRAIGAISNLSRRSLELATNFEQTAISFEVFTGSAEAAKQLIEELDQFSLTTPFSPDQVNAAAKTLLGFGRNANQVLGDLESLGNVAAATGTDIGQLSLVFGQVAGVGRLQGQDALQFINAGIPLYQVLSESIGVSVGQVKELQSEGKITFEVLEQAFREASEEGGKFEGALIRQSQTIGGLFSTLQGAADKILKEVGNAFLPLLRQILPPLIELSFRVAEGFGEIVKFAEPFINLIKIAIRPLRDAFSSLADRISGGVAASETFQKFLSFLAQSFTVLSRLLAPVIRGIGQIFDLFKGTGIIDDFLGVISNIPAVINGVVEAIKAIPSAAIAAFEQLALSIEANLLRVQRLAKELVGADTFDLDLRIQNIELEKEQIDNSVEGVRDAFQRGFDEIKDIKVELPEADTDENKEAAFDSGEAIGEEVGKGVEKGAKKTIRTAYQKLGDEVKRLQTVLQNQVAEGNLEAARFTGIELAKAIEALDNVDRLIDRINNPVGQIAPLESIGSQNTIITSELDRYLGELRILQDELDKVTDPITRERLEQEAKALQEIISKFLPEIELPNEEGSEGGFLAKLLGLTDEEEEDFKQRLSKALDATKDFVNSILEQQQKRIEGEISIQEDNVAKATELAEKGNVEILQAEEERLDSLLKQREDAVRRQQQLAAIEIAVNQALAASESAKGIASAIGLGFPAALLAVPLMIGLIAQVGSGIAAVNGAFGNIPGFIEGTELVGADPRFSGRKKKQGQDGYLLWADGQERIVPPEINKALKGIPNSRLPEAVRALNILSNKPVLNSGKMSVVRGNSESKLEEKLDRLTSSVENMRLRVSLDAKGFNASQQIATDRQVRRKRSVA